MRNTCGALTASIESRRAAAFCFPTRRLALRLNELALVAVLIALSLLSRATKRAPLPSLAMLLCGSLVAPSVDFQWSGCAGKGFGPPGGHAGVPGWDSICLLALSGGFPDRKPRRVPVGMKQIG